MNLIETNDILKVKWEKLIIVKEKIKENKAAHYKYENIENIVTAGELYPEIEKIKNDLDLLDANFTSDPNRWCFEFGYKDSIITLDGKPFFME